MFLRLLCVVMKVKGEIEGNWANGRTPADVASDYERLFTNSRNNLKKALRSSRYHTNVLANKIFEVKFIFAK